MKTATQAARSLVVSARSAIAFVLSALVAVLFALPVWSQQPGFTFSAPRFAVQARLEGEVRPGSRADLIVKLKIAHPFHINANPASEEYLIPTTIEVDKKAGVSAGKPVYPAALLKKFSFYEKKLRVYEGAPEIRVPLQLSAAFKGGPISGTLRYQACNDKACLAPANLSWSTSGTPASTSTPRASTSTSTSGGTSLEADAVALRNRFKVSGFPTLVFLNGQGRERADLRAGEELTQASLEAKIAAARSGATLEVDKDSALGWGARLQASPLWLQLVLVFVGGLLLNLTPCVYPMIPITVGYFGAQSEGRAGKTFGLALLYVLGLALVYSALGVFAASTGGLFGATMQSPWVLGGVALVMGSLGLSMAGLFTINPPRWALSRSGGKKGAMGALAMGALLGIVAAPCVGPVVAALLAYVGARADKVLGFALFFFLSLGLGLPYLLLGTFSGAAKSLPRSGTWLEKSKKFFAVPLVLAALYYASLAIKAASVARPPSGDRWAAATVAALEEARAQNRPVVIDFRADWCLPCIKMEEEILSKEATRRAAAEHNALLLQADLTSAQG
jgi:thiol:disulfide interchange protein DsbD